MELSLKNALLRLDEIDLFRYVLCLDEELDDTIKNVSIITFDISRYGKFKHTIFLDNLVTQKKGVREAEEFLSKRVTMEYYNKVKDDLFAGLKYTEKELIEQVLFSNRGSLLGEHKYLESATVVEGNLVLECGS
jgi:hypothetical protein